MGFQSMNHEYDESLRKNSKTKTTNNAKHIVVNFRADRGKNQ